MPMSMPLTSKSPFEFARENATREESLRVNTETVASAMDSLNNVSVNLPLTIPALLCATTVSTDRCMMTRIQIDLLINRGDRVWLFRRQLEGKLVPVGSLESGVGSREIQPANKVVALTL